MARRFEEECALVIDASGPDRPLTFVFFAAQLPTGQVYAIEWLDSLFAGLHERGERQNTQNRQDENSPHRKLLESSPAQREKRLITPARLRKVIAIDL
jgi:hypothetical protein